MATIAHTGCVILIAFPLQQWIHEHASMLCYTYIACFVSQHFKTMYCFHLQGVVAV